MGLFGFNAEKKLKKANEHLVKGIYYDARIAFEEIMLRDGVDPSISTQARDGWKRSRQALMEEQVSEARRLLQAGEPAGARECCLAAIEQAGEDLDASEVKEILSQIEKGQTPAAKILDGLDNIGAAAQIPAEEAEEGEAVAGGDEAVFEVLMEALPREHAEAYRSFGPDFREGFLRLQEGRAEEALERFQRMTEGTATHPLARVEQAQALRQLKRYEEALEILEQIDPPRGAERLIQEIRVDLLQRVGRGEEAEEEARRIHESAPEEIEAAILYAEVLLENGRAQEALETVLPLRTPRPVPAIDGIVARAYRATGRTQEARDLLEGTVEGFFQGPGGMHAQFPIWAARELLGLYVDVGEDPKRVRSLVQHLIRHDPQSIETYKQILARYVEEREERGGD